MFLTFLVRPTAIPCPCGVRSLLAAVVLFQNNVPATTVILRSVNAEHTSLAMGTQNVMFRLFGTIPGPIVLGV